MKKILSLLLALTLFVVAMPISAFADTTSTDGLFGVIVDADGNIVERIPMSRATYVNSIITIPAGGSYISYQYEPNEYFKLALRTYDENGNTITEPGYDFEGLVEISSSIGSNRGDGGVGIIKINDNPDSPFNSRSNAYTIYVKGVQGNYKYYSAKVTNNSTKANKIRIMIVLEEINTPY